MADSDSGERTEEPTAKKLSEARQKGQIPRSKDLGTMFVLISSAVALLMVGDYLVLSLSQMMKRMFTFTREEVMDTQNIFNIVGEVFAGVMYPMLWIFGIITLAA
ncbi:EscU/YscU/HrcU family type III secretion system export apparatus switch protein [Thalassotalea euphylliae]|uniref:Flagellar biosynthetic protein FlhB n=1 Tax=Thalassotalea euphylliae TaxID=1655234 RepID=A0A3E0UE76_9GAMM|nr:EscU/YscU/HrcU family type III secretion system export apparatus switch protein [Thalassotalea euphylliae]REL34867.1 hypothetical protein DXX92_05535 [Thalassotalea euphylliae]